MDILIRYHETKRHYNPHEFDDCNMKQIIKIEDMPKSLSIDCEFMEQVSLQYDRVIIFLKEMPHRIDYDSYMETLYLFNQKEVGYVNKPYYLIDGKKHLTKILWEIGERESVNVEEVGEMVEV